MSDPHILRLDRIEKAWYNAFTSRANEMSEKETKKTSLTESSKNNTQYITDSIIPPQMTYVDDVRCPCCGFLTHPDALEEACAGNHYLMEAELDQESRDDQRARFRSE